MNTLGNIFRTTRLSIWLLLCALILAATSVNASGDQRPLAAVDILGSPDAAVDGKFAVGTATPGGKVLTVAGVIDFVGAGTVHNYFTQGPGNNMQIRSNVDEYNAVGNSMYAQWNLVMGASLDVFSIRRSPAGSTYNEDALFWIEGDTGEVGIATVDTSNGATIPFSPSARLHVETETGHAIYGISSSTSSAYTGVYGESNSNGGIAIFGWGRSTSGQSTGVSGLSDSPSGGRGVTGSAWGTSGVNYGVYGESHSSSGGIGVYGLGNKDSGTNYGVYGESNSSSGYDFYAGGSGTDYGPFTGAHETRLSDFFPTEIQLGMIVSVTGETQIRRSGNGDVDFSSTLPTVRLADTPEDPAVLGVLVAEVTLPEDHWYTASEGERFGTVNALGEGRVWVTNINGEIKAGDAITTSEIPGYGQRQSDDILHIYTLGKATEMVDWDLVTEKVTFNGQEYKIYLLAVVYMSG
jgi:hypothetical protein